jgi:hypothetical protein
MALACPSSAGKPGTPHRRAKDSDRRLKVFVEELARLGWIEGVNVQFETRRRGGDPEVIRRGAVELGAAAPDVIFAIGGTATERLLQVTKTILIVFSIVPDPVGGGVVCSGWGTCFCPSFKFKSHEAYGTDQLIGPGMRNKVLEQTRQTRTGRAATLSPARDPEPTARTAKVSSTVHFASDLSHPSRAIW